jgi:hypothetical protein
VYMIGRLTEVNFTKETRLLENVLAILQELRSAWAEIDFKKAAAQALQGKGQDGGNGTAFKPNALRQPSDTSRILSVTI